MRPVTTRFCVGVLILPADLDRVVALDLCKMFLPIIGSIGTGDDRVPLNAAHESVGGVPKGVPVESWHLEVFFVLRASAQGAGIEA